MKSKKKGLGRGLTALFGDQVKNGNLLTYDRRRVFPGYLEKLN